MRLFPNREKPPEEISVRGGYEEEPMLPQPHIVALVKYRQVQERGLSALATR